MSHPHARDAGFTLVELMVALTGGLFVILAVLALARDSGRFYQRETRVANATIGGMMGFDRLRADIARAGFLATPSVVADPRVCAKPQASWPLMLRNLASMQVTVPGAATNTALAANGRNPPTLLLAGSYTSPDTFAASKLINNGTSIVFNLEVSQPALLRLGSGLAPDDTAMQSVFATGRALRVVQNGKQFYGQIVTAKGGTTPSVTISNTAPPIQFRSGSADCGLQEFADASAIISVNVVNFIQYQVRTPLTATGALAYADLYAQSDGSPGESTRTELIRVEQDLSGSLIDGSEEIVAEYAVDFNLTVTAATTKGYNPTLGVFAPGSANYTTYTGPVFGTANTPERLRSVRVRLGVRSREADRRVDSPPDGGAAVGLFRFNVGSGAEPFARVRTFQADVALHNQADITW